MLNQLLPVFAILFTSLALPWQQSSLFMPTSVCCSLLIPEIPIYSLKYHSLSDSCSLCVSVDSSLYPSVSAAALLGYVTSGIDFFLKLYSLRSSRLEVTRVNSIRAGLKLVLRMRVLLQSKKKSLNQQMWTKQRNKEW